MSRVSSKSSNHLHHRRAYSGFHHAQPDAKSSIPPLSHLQRPVGRGTKRPALVSSSPVIVAARRLPRKAAARRDRLNADGQPETGGDRCVPFLRTEDLGAGGKQGAGMRSMREADGHGSVPAALRHAHRAEYRARLAAGELVEVESRLDPRALRDGERPPRRDADRRAVRRLDEALAPAFGPLPRDPKEQVAVPGAGLVRDRLVVVVAGVEPEEVVAQADPGGREQPARLVLVQSPAYRSPPGRDRRSDSPLPRPATTTGGAARKSAGTTGAVLPNVPATTVPSVTRSPCGETAKDDEIAALPGRVTWFRCSGATARLNSPPSCTRRQSPPASRVVRRVKSTTPSPLGRVATRRADAFSIRARFWCVVRGNTASTEARAAATRAVPKLVPAPTPGVTNGAHTQASDTASQPDECGWRTMSPAASTP